MTPQWTTACPDWERRILAGESLVPFSPLFPAEAKAAEAVFRELRIVDAAGSPKAGETCRPWVFDFVGSVFGAYDPESGRRLVREFLLLISKKNGKSTIAAGVMLTAIIRNWRKSAEFIILASTIEAANNAFGPVRDMIRVDPDLDAMFQVQDHIRTVTHRQTRATLKVVAADSETVSGKKAVGILVDELWAFGEKANAENMLREATGGLASRPEGFVIYLTTQSDKVPAGVFRKKLIYAREVRDGSIKDPQFLPILYEFPPSMMQAEGYLQKDNFWVTNPNLGLSVDVPFLEREFDKAELGGRDSLNGFLAKHLNVEIGLALAADNWAGAEFWAINADPSLTMEELLERSDVVEVGIDGGGLDDLLGLAVLGRCKTTGRWLLWNRAWAHQVALARRKDIAPRLLDFEKAGELTIVQSPGDDVIEVATLVEQIEESGLLDKIGVDSYGISAIVQELENRGITQDRIVGVPQGWKLNSAIKTAERKLAGGELIHGGSLLMAWCVSNAKVEPRGNAISITKQGSRSAKIDPLMATFNAVVLLYQNPQNQPSVYDILAKTEANDPQTGGVDPAILGDPAHPQWQAMRERAERRFALADEDD